MLEGRDEVISMVVSQDPVQYQVPVGVGGWRGYFLLLLIGINKYLVNFNRTQGSTGPGDTKVHGTFQLIVITLSFFFKFKIYFYF